MSDTELRSVLKVAWISQAETISGRNSAVTIAEAAGVATVTTTQAHNYRVGQRVYFSGATGDNATVYNHAGGYVILTVPSTTTFTIEVPSGTGAGAGTINVDMPIDCAGMVLSAFQTPAALTSIALTFQGDIDGSGTFVAIKGPTGASVSWVVAASGLYVPDSTAQQFGGVQKIKLVGGSAEAAARQFKVTFLKTNP